MPVSSLTGQLSFSSAVSGFAEEAIQQTETILRESIVELVTEMQRIGRSTAYPQGQGGFLPVDTGYLQNSLEVSFTSMPAINPSSYPPESAGSGFGLHSIRWDSQTTYAEIRTAKLGETTFLGYTAAYSLIQEYANETTKAFVRKAGQRWPMIVQSTAEKYKSGAIGGVSMVETKV